MLLNESYSKRKKTFTTEKQKDEIPIGSEYKKEGHKMKKAKKNNFDPTTSAERFTNYLYVHRSTLRCAINKCIPCMHKLFPGGYFYDYKGEPQSDMDATVLKLPPNQRPELCPRSNQTSLTMKAN